MLVKINPTANNDNEWCILEFQGDVLGDLNGSELGKIDIKEVIY
jgi:hypothetical protein